MKSLIKVKTDKPLSPAEERYLRRLVIGNLIAKYITLFCQVACLGFIVYLVLEWVIPGFTNISPFKDFNYIAAIMNILVLVLFLVFILGTGLLMLGWHPWLAGYSIMTIHAVIARKGRSLQIGPLIAPPPWRKYLPEQNPVPLKVAEFNGGFNIGRRGPILLGVPELGLDMVQHAELGLLKYRNPLFPGIMIPVGFLGVLVIWSGNIDRIGFFQGFITSPSAWVMEDVIHKVFTAFSAVGIWSFLTFLFISLRNLIIRYRINKEIAGQPQKKSTWYK